MKLEKFKDKNGKEIDTDKIYFDEKHGVAQISIINIDGLWYVSPRELDCELLSDVIDGLVQSDTEWVKED